MYLYVVFVDTTQQILHNTDTDQSLATHIPITNERAEVTISDFEELDQTSLRLP